MRDSKSKSSNHFARFTKFVLTVALSVAALPVISADETYCKWGDCKNGLGERVYPSGSSSISNFKNGLRSGYTISFFESGFVCESRFIEGKSEGLRYCQTSQGRRSYSYTDRNKQESGSPHLVISSKGKITKAGRWYPSRGTFTLTQEIDVPRITLDHAVLRRTGLSLADRLPSWYSAPADNKRLLDEKRIQEFVSGKEETAFEVADKKFREEQKSENCVVGDCTNGPGRYVWNDGNFTIANYVDGNREGYAVYVRKNGDTECERIYRKNTVNGLSVCKTVYKGKVRAHFSYLVDGNQNEEDLLLIADSGGRVATYRPASKNPDEDYRRLEQDYEAIRSASEPRFRNQLSEAFREISLPSKALFESHVNVKATKTDDESDAACEFGDCKNGFGSYRFKSGDQHVGYFKNSRQHGYGILLQERRPDRKRVCETRYQDGRRSGLRVCLTYGTDVATAYYYSDGGKANGRGISWNASSREIVRLGLWRNSEFIREEPADLRQIASDWQSIKGSPQAVMRASFLTDEFLALELPSQDDQSEWLRQKELERTKKTQVIPEEVPFKLGCISGDCENGFGEFAKRESTLTGNFRNGKISGYALITRGESQCEALMRNGAHAGIEHCVDVDTGKHTFSEKNSSGLQAASISISKTGKLIDYKVYEDDKPMSVSFASSKDKDRLAMLDFEFLVQQLDDLRKSSTRDFRSRKVSALDSIPEFGALNKAAADEKSASRPSSKSKANRRAELEPPMASRSKSNLQRLAYIVAELNAGSRQINFNYRLDKVRIDPNKFELVYEFTAMRPIRELDTSVISVANQTAYCSSSKLKPFRDEKMSARWIYVDVEDQQYEVLTAASNC